MSENGDDRPLRILLSAYALSSARGSEPGNSWRLAEGLARAGHQVTVLTSTRYTDEQQVPAELRANLMIEHAHAPAPRLLARGHVGVYAGYRYWQRQSVRTAQELLAGSPNRFDVVHHYSWGSLFWGSPLTALGLPFVFGPVGGGSTSPREMMGLYRPRDRWMERLRAVAGRSLRLNPWARSVVRRSAVVLAANSDTAHLIHRLGGASSLMMPETTPHAWLARAVPDRYSTVRLGSDTISVIWVARLLPRKGVLLAMDIAAKLPPEYVLHVVGDGSELERAQQHAAARGIDNRVVFHGRVPWESLPSLYDSADIMLFTSIRDTTGAQLLEAASTGLPIVAIDHQGVHDYVPMEAGHLEQLDTPETMSAGMAAATVSICSDIERFRAASASARQFAETHRRDAAITTLVAGYRRAIERHRR